MKTLTDEQFRWVGAAVHWLMRLPPMSLGIGFLVLFLVMVWSNWTIVKRAGHPGCLSLMMFVPCLNVLFLLWFAFTKWPVQGAKNAK